MLRWFGVFLGSAFVALVAARYLQSAIWLDFLWLFALCTGLAAAMAVGLLMRRFAPPPWPAWTALLLSLGALAGRARLLRGLLAQPLRRQTIDLADVLLAASTVAWGLLALLWGVHALSGLVERPTGERLAKAPTIAAASAVIGALFCVAPLWRLLGLGIDHFTILGLFGLAAVAYGIDRLYQRFSRRSG